MEKNAIRKDEEVIRRSKTEIVIKLLKYLKPYKFEAVIVTILMILVMLAGIVNPYLLGIAIDDYVVNKNVNGLIYIGIVLVVINIISWILSKIFGSILSS